MTELPLPIRFELPGPLWEPVVPESLGVENAVFLAVRRGLEDDYSPTITIAGDWRNDAATVADIADESVARLRADATEVELLDRRVTESDNAPAVTQSLGAVMRMHDRHYDLRQLQAIMGYVDVNDPTRRAVIIHTLTCTFKQFTEIGLEFQVYLGSVEVVIDEGSDPEH